MKAQVGIEIMGVVGFAFLVLIPLFASFYIYSGSFWDRLSIEKADAAASRVAGMVEMVGVQGDAMLTQEIVVPENVERVEVNGKEVIFTLTTSSGTTEIVKSTSHEAISKFSSLRPGSYTLKAEAKRGIVTLELG
jgi:hypothetical protein